MPELPEAEIAGRQLHRWLSGQPVERVELLDTAAVRRELSTKPSMAAAKGRDLLNGLLGAAPERPVRHGKRLGWPWGDKALLVHLGMSGKFVQRRIDEERPAFARIGWFRGEHVVWFVDQRRFACVVVVDRADLDAGMRDGHGPDALDEALDGPGLKAALKGKRAIKVALMDQAKLAGIGNIQAAEALFKARIDPRTACSALTDRQWDELARVIPIQLQEVIDGEDAGEIVYMTEGGEVDNPFAVYKREGEECPVCATPIATIEQTGRTTYFCPQCQR
ncbi:MAG: bifunctional DNA-formamidopyrimidine glycosylase/DNA-(apurinic or apyrimidinic site) lyase [Alphaproteobacteria bacterium]|nr:bifunctional DNA-formamidopyrimidine glycosylase/DNA-(apurinic or apyrimidinic site) lyase [Alphaproteobacteria bacterium]